MDYKNTFEYFLGVKHSDQYNGIDDNMLDDFISWLQDLDPQEIIDYAEEWGEKLIKNYQLSDKEKSLLETIIKK